jgi:hypothetical protein
MAANGPVYRCCVGMWWGGPIEWFAIGQLLGITWSDAGMVRAGLFQCDTLLVGAVPVPAGMGTQEAGKMALATALGLAPQMGVAMSLIRRGREMLRVITAVVLALMEARGRRSAYPPGSNRLAQTSEPS